MEENCLIIACRIFYNELNYLKKSGLIDHEILFLDSMLHMDPEKLKSVLNKEISRHRNKKILLLYGECHSRMTEIENKNIARIRGVNCCEILLGPTHFRTLRKKGVFILLPEWLERWREVFIEELGFKTSNLASKFMNDFHTELVFIDTGLMEVPLHLLEEVSNYTGLKYRIEKCENEFLLSGIRETTKKLRHVRG